MYTRKKMNFVTRRSSPPFRAIETCEKSFPANLFFRCVRGHRHEMVATASVAVAHALTTKNLFFRRFFATFPAAFRCPRKTCVDALGSVCFVYVRSQGERVGYSMMACVTRRESDESIAHFLAEIVQGVILIIFQCGVRKRATGKSY